MENNLAELKILISRFEEAERAARITDPTRANYLSLVIAELYTAYSFALIYVMKEGQ